MTLQLEYVRHMTQLYLSKAQARETIRFWKVFHGNITQYPNRHGSLLLTVSDRLIWICIDMCIYAESCPQCHDVPRVSHQLKYWRFHKIPQLNQPSAHQSISPLQELPESLEAQLLLQMRQLRGDTRAAEKRLSSSKAIRDMSRHVETCRGPGRWFPGWMIVIYMWYMIYIYIYIVMNSEPSMMFSWSSTMSYRDIC